MAKAGKSCYAINYVYQSEIEFSPSEVGVLESLRELVNNLRSCIQRHICSGIHGKLKISLYGLRSPVLK